MFNKKVELKEDEQLMLNALTKMVERKDSVLEYDQESFSWLISLAELEYYILLDGVGIQLSNHKFLINKRLSDKQQTLFKSVVSQENSRRLKAKRETIFRNETELLTNIIEKL